MTDSAPCHAVGRARAFLVACGLALAASAGAHGPTHDAAAAKPPQGAPGQQPFGIAGNPARVSRTVAIEMNDTMRFSPATLEVTRGETVRFVVRNLGKVPHELVLGTEASLKDHAAMMKQHPGMAHDEPGMIHVAPGAAGEIVWRFNRPGDFRFGCLVPGHYEAGMAGRVIVK